MEGSFFFLLLLILELSEKKIKGKLENQREDEKNSNSIMRRELDREKGNELLQNKSREKEGSCEKKKDDLRQKLPLILF